MDLNYNTINLFPSIVHIFDVNGFDEIQNELIDYAYDLNKKYPEGNLLSNRGGWQAKPFNISNEADPLHKFLTDSIGGFHVIKKEVNFVIDAWLFGDYDAYESYDINTKKVSEGDESV